MFTAPPERVYKAILDPAANCKFLPPNGFTARVHELDAKVGATFRMSFTTNTPEEIAEGMSRLAGVLR